MRIEGYPLPVTPSAPPVARGNSQNNAAVNPASFAAEMPGETEASTPQERLRRVLEERRWVAEAAFSQTPAEGELGKHIDLRV